jgi:hypothetical protein
MDGFREVDLELPEEVVEKLKDWHAKDTIVGLCCNAHGEGLNCCIDFLIGEASWRKDFLNG